MLYNKDDKRYVDMCKEFDEEFWHEHRNDEKLYKYMYFTYYMLACKDNFFIRFEDYDGYSQFAATTIYVRFLKKFNKGEKVKSLLNYAKSTKKFLKVMYQNQEFAEVLSEDVGVDVNKLHNNLRDAVQADYQEGKYEDMEESLLSIVDIIYRVTNEEEYKHDAVTNHRIYMSLLLTMLDSITLPKSLLRQIRGRKKNLTEDEVITALNAERDRDVILWKLNYDMRGYIKLLVNRVRQLLSEDINETEQYYTLPDDLLDSILASAYTEYSLVPDSEDDYE